MFNEIVLNELQTILPTETEEFILTEAGISFPKNDIYLVVNSSVNRNYGNDQYFKIYNSKSYTIATKVMRIKFQSPEYVYHKNSGGKDDFILNSSEKKELIQLLKSRSTMACVWEYLIYEFNKTCKPVDQMPLELKMPDYTKLK